MAAERILVAGIIGIVLLGVFALAFADVPKMSEENVPIIENNTEMNTVEVNMGVNAIETNKEPMYQPVSEENTTTVSEKNAMEKTENVESNIMEKTKSVEQNAVKTTEETKSEMRETVKTEEQKEENVVYHRSDMVAIPVPAMVEEQMEKKIEVNGVEAEVKCEGGACVVKMPKSAAENAKMQAITMALQQAIPTKAKIKEMSVIEKNGFAVAKAVAVEENRTKVMYATADQGAFAVIVSIPKSVLKSAADVEGNVVVLQMDPVLKIYLKSEGNSIAVAGYTVDKDVNIVSNDSIEFAVCSVRIGDVTSQKSDQGYTLRFKIYDGTEAVYVPNVRITAPGMSVVPQYDEVSKTYSATVPSIENAKIVANVDGCGEITYYIQSSERQTSSTTAAIVALVIVALIVAGWFVWKA